MKTKNLLSLTASTYLHAFENDLMSNIKGGTIHDFLKESKVVYCPDFKCPTYQIVHTDPVTGWEVYIGGKFCSNGKPELRIFEELDFI